MNDSRCILSNKSFSSIFGYESRINNSTLGLHHKIQYLTNILIEKKDIELKNSQNRFKKSKDSEIFIAN